MLADAKADVENLPLLLLVLQVPPRPLQLATDSEQTSDVDDEDVDDRRARVARASARRAREAIAKEEEEKEGRREKK